MKIVCMVQNMAVGGVQRLIADETNELVRRGHDVWLVTFEKTENDFLAQVQIPEDRKIYIPYPRMRNIAGFVRVVAYLLRVRPRILMTHLWFANTVGRLAGACAFIASVLAFEHSNYDAVKPARQHRIDRILQHIGRIIAVSSAVRESLVGQGIKQERIVVVPNGIDLTKYAAGSEHGSHFLFVGRLVRDKGADLFLEALSLAPDATAKIVGDGPERLALEKRAKESDLAGRVEFLGTRLDVPELLRHAYALVIPSRREGFGLVAAEALASGVPVIATRVGGLTDVVEDGVSGVTVPLDPAAFADAITRVQKDVHFRDTLAAQARLSAARFSITSHVDAVLRLSENKLGY